MNLKNRRIITAVLCMLLCAAVLAGCGRSLIITTGFGRGDVFRIGSESCKMSEVRVYLLDLQKENERLFQNAIWESESSPELQEAVKEQALAQITRVKALNQLAVKRNVMLTDMFREYALADKTWTSLGETAVQTYEEFYKKTQCDLNTKYWQTVKLKKVEGDPQAAGFADCYRAVFGTSAQGNSGQDSTQAAAEETQAE